MSNQIFLSRFGLQKNLTLLQVNMAAGICSTIDEEECIVFVDILKDAVILLPICLENGTIQWPDCKYHTLYTIFYLYLKQVNEL